MATALLRMLYPNWLSVEFFTEGWDFFLSQELYNLSFLSTLVLLSQYYWGTVVSLQTLWYLLLVVATRRYLAGGICTSKKKLSGKNVIITGSNIGIGKETARDLAKRGANLIMACRNINAATAAAEDIKTSTGSKSVTAMKLDLSSLQSVREFAGEIKKKGIDIHILINNAGMMMCPYMETQEGFELQMGTNHLGHFLLTNLLLPQLQHGQEARIINISSIGHLGGKLNFDDFNYKTGYDKVKAYYNSKLANVLFTRQLAKRLKGSKIQVFSLHPGFVQSNLSRHVFNEVFNAYVNCVWQKTTLEGAQTTIYCATEATQHPEMYFSDCSVGWASSYAKDDESAERLWKLSEQLVNLK